MVELGYIYEFACGGGGPFVLRPPLGQGALGGPRRWPGEAVEGSDRSPVERICHQLMGNCGGI